MARNFNVDVEALVAQHLVDEIKARVAYEVRRKFEEDLEELINQAAKQIWQVSLNRSALDDVLQIAVIVKEKQND